MTKFHLHRSSIDRIKQVNICCHSNTFIMATKAFTDLPHCIHEPNLTFTTIIILELFTIMVSKCRYSLFSNTLLAELAYNNLLLWHFQLFIFPSIVRVSQLCLGLTLLLKCSVQTFGLDSRLLVLLDRFDRFILFWLGFQFARSVTSCVPLCKSFEHMLRTSVPFHRSFERTFFVASQGSTWLVKIFLRCHENFAHDQQKINHTQAELVYSSETDRQKKHGRGRRVRNAGSACRVVLKQQMRNLNKGH